MPVVLSLLGCRNGTGVGELGRVPINSNHLADRLSIGSGIAFDLGVYGKHESSRNLGRSSQHFPLCSIPTPTLPLTPSSLPDLCSLSLPGVPSKNQVETNNQIDSENRVDLGHDPTGTQSYRDKNNVP